MQKYLFMTLFSLVTLVFGKFEYKTESDIEGCDISHG